MSGGTQKACEASAVLGGNYFWCDRPALHLGPHANDKHDAAWGSSMEIAQELPETVLEVAERGGDMRRAALSAAVRISVNGTPTHIVIERAEDFLAWLGEEQ